MIFFRQNRRASIYKIGSRSYTSNFSTSYSNEILSANRNNNFIIKSSSNCVNVFISTIRRSNRTKIHRNKITSGNCNKMGSSINDAFNRNSKNTRICTKISNVRKYINSRYMTTSITRCFIYKMFFNRRLNRYSMRIAISTAFARNK